MVRLPLLLALALVAHGLSLANGFVYDDHRFVEGNAALDGLTVADALLDPGTHTTDLDRDVYRPLRALGHAFDRSRWGLEPFGYHLHSLLVHLGCVALGWRLARRLLGDPAAWLGAGLLAVHPAGVEVVGWVTSRGDQYAVLFSLAALELVLAPQLPRAPALVLAACGAALAVLGKESAAVLPALGWLLGELGDTRARRTRWAGCAALTLGVVTALALRQMALAGASPVQTPPHGGSWASQIGWSLYGLERLVEHLLNPAWLSIDPPQVAWVDGAPIALRPRTWAGALAFVAPLLLWRRHRTQAVLLGWAVLAWLPSGSLLVTLRTLVTDRAAYPMLLPLGALAAPLVLRRPRLGVPAALAVLLTLALVAADRCGDFADDQSLWQRVLDDQPGSVRAHLGLAAESSDAVSRGVWLRSAVEQAAPGSKEQAVSLARLGDHLLRDADDPAGASRVLSAAVEALQDWARREGREGRDLAVATGDLGEALVRLGRVDEAEAFLLAAAAGSTRPAPLLLRLAVLLRVESDRRRDPALRVRADRALEEALRTAPADPLVRIVAEGWSRRSDEATEPPP